MPVKTKEPIKLDAILTPESILNYLKKDVLAFEKKHPKETKTKATKLSYLKEQLKDNFFKDATHPSDADLLALLSTDTRFNAYPYLREALTVVFSLNDLADDESVKEAIKQLEKPHTDDWNNAHFNAEFQKINGRYKYFTDPMQTEAYEKLFKELAITCRTITVFSETNNTDDDADAIAYDYAYKIMALFINPNEPIPSLKDIAKSTQDLLTKRDTPINKPFHDVLAMKLKLPVASDIGDPAGWKALIKKQGEKSFPFFAHAKEIESKTSSKKAPVTITEAKKADVQIKYKRASEDLEFAILCYNYDTGVNSDADEEPGLEETFNISLDYIQSDWPKKTRDNLKKTYDNLPDLITEGEGKADGYYWVKLPPNDKRALILGKITDCCQSMGGDSEACVKDAVSLSDNGLYVLLKHKRGDKLKPKNEDGSINYENFQIIGQSYAWKSTSDNLCLDSIECLSNSIPKDALQHILSQFTQQVFANDSTIECVNIGRGGKTPSHLFPNTNNTLDIRQGQMYGDAADQYVVAQSPDLAITQHPELNLKWKAWQAEHPALNNRATALLAFLQTLSPEQLMEALQARDVNGRTLLHAAASNIIALDINDILALYPDDAHRLNAVKMKDNFGQTVLHIAVNNIKAFYAIWNLSPDDIQRFEWVRAQTLGIKYRPSDNPFNSATRYFTDESGQTLGSNDKNRSALHDAVGNIEVFTAITKIYPDDIELLEAMEKRDLDGRAVLHEAMAHLDVFTVIWNTYLDNARRFKAIETVNYNNDTPILFDAADYPDTFIKMWDVYPDDAQRFKGVTAIGRDKLSVLQNSFNKPAILMAIVEKLSSAHLLEAVTLKTYRGTSLDLAVRLYPQAFMMILDRLSPEHLVTALALRDRDGDTILEKALQHPAIFIMLSKKITPDKILELVEIQKAATPKQFIAIWNSYPDDGRRISLLAKKNHLGETVLQDASRESDYFAAVLNCLTISQLTRVLKNNPKAFDIGYGRINHIEICQAYLQQKLTDREDMSDDMVAQLQKEIKQATHMDQLLNPDFLSRIEQLKPAPSQAFRDRLQSMKLEVPPESINHISDQVRPH